MDPELLGMLRITQELGDVQQCLRRNAPHIKTDPSGPLSPIDQDGFQARISGVKSSGVPSRSRTNHDHIGLARFLCH